jgi:DNA-binding CsgD family transcriptional regulator/PAS domain-containing protein
MDEAEHVSRLIGDVYDAALDPASWPKALEKTCRYVEGMASILLSQDSAQKTAEFHFSWGDDPEYTRSYQDTYVKMNPLLLPMVLTTETGSVVANSDLLPIEEFRTTRFYQEWAQPQGYLDAVSATLDKSATGYAALAVTRHERDGLVDDGMRRRMQLLAPHFRRAVAIGKVIEANKVEAATLADALDGLAAGMFLVDASGRIVHANARGHAIVAEAKVLKGLGGRLSAIDLQADKTLADVFTTADAGDVALGAKGIAVPLAARDGERWVAHVLPLTSGARRQASVCYAAVAAVFVREAALDLHSPLETLSDLYELTPAELRVLMAIVEIGGVPDVAPVLGISETTVKTHLRRLFEKTGTKRQADLVKLVAAFMSPLGA